MFNKFFCIFKDYTTHKQLINNTTYLLDKPTFRYYFYWLAINIRMAKPIYKYHMRKLLLYISVLLIPETFIGQNSNNKDSIDLHIVAIEKITRYPLPNVAILTMDNDTLVLTDHKGKAKTRVLKKTKYYKATHTGHIGIQIQPKRDFIFNRKLGSVVMRASDTLQFGSEWKKKRISITASINELINGSIASRYLYQIDRSHAFGCKLSLYLFDMFRESKENEDYKGFKVSTLYQYYLANHRRGGIYLEPALSFGYFNANNIKYHGGIEEVICRSEKFWSFGLSSSIGFVFYIKNSAIIGFSFGFQYYPIGAPRNIHLNGEDYQLVSNDIAYSGPPYWYFVGPGAIIDFSLYLGMKF